MQAYAKTLGIMIILAALAIQLTQAVVPKGPIDVFVSRAFTVINNTNNIFASRAFTVINNTNNIFASRAFTVINNTNNIIVSRAFTVLTSSLDCNGNGIPDECEVALFPADISGPGGPGFPDGCVDAFDLGTLLGAWCSSASDPDPPGDIDPPCEACTSPNFALADISGCANVPDGCVDAFDLAKLLAEWCSVAGGNPCGTCGP